MTTRDLQDQLRDLLDDVLRGRDDADDPANDLADHVEGLRRIATYEEVGMMTTDPGLVITTDDGQEFQVTIVQSR
ncbi:MAG TPA: hypothetical protein VJZ71_16670 [Phycisphaerae bacterium]|nr:hypothetical protein [Phycisphaerae bacterium]